MKSALLLVFVSYVMGQALNSTSVALNASTPIPLNTSTPIPSNTTTASNNFQSLMTLYAQAPTSGKKSIAAILNLMNTSPIFQSAISNLTQTTFFLPIDSAVATFMGTSPTKFHIDQVLLYHLLPKYFVPTVAREIQQTLLNIASPNNSTTNTTVILQPQSIVIDYDTSISIKYGLGACSVIEKIDLGNIIVFVTDQVFTIPLPLINTLSLTNFTSFIDFTAFATDIDGVSLKKKLDSLRNISVLAVPNPALDKYFSTHSLSPAQTAQLLGLHIIPSIAYSTDLLSGIGKSWQVTTQSLVKISVSVSNSGRVTLQGPGNKSPINLIAADYLTENGVMHVIDGILLPDTVGMKDTQSGSLKFGMSLGLIVFLLFTA